MAVLQSQSLGCYNKIGGCRASAQIWSQTHVMTLKKVLAVTKTLFQMILKRQGNPICHSGDRAGSTGYIFGAWNFHESSLNRVRVHAVSLSAPHPINSNCCQTRFHRYPLLLETQETKLLPGYNGLGIFIRHYTVFARSALSVLDR